MQQQRQRHNADADPAERNRDEPGGPNGRRGRSDEDDGDEETDQDDDEDQDAPARLGVCPHDRRKLISPCPKGRGDEQGDVDGPLFCWMNRSIFLPALDKRDSVRSTCSSISPIILPQ